MKKICIALVACIAMAACGNETTTENNSETKNGEIRSKGEASEVHSPQEAVPDSLTIKNDSVLMPESP